MRTSVVAFWTGNHLLNTFLVFRSATNLRDMKKMNPLRFKRGILKNYELCFDLFFGGLLDSSFANG